MTTITKKAVPILMLLLVFAPFSSYAALVSWTFDNSVFDDSGTITGSFVYDADTNDYFDFAIVTTAGSTFSGTTYNADTVIFGSASVLFFPDSQAANLVGASALSLFFTGGLSNLGGTVNLLILDGLNAGSREGLCQTQDCGSVAGFRGLVSGSVIGTPVAVSPVPVPAAFWLFGTALIGFVELSRRRKVA